MLVRPAPRANVEEHRGLRRGEHAVRPCAEEDEQVHLRLVVVIAAERLHDVALEEAGREHAASGGGEEEGDEGANAHTPPSVEMCGTPTLSPSLSLPG